MAAITYTPNGIARAPGYFDPKNPYDTGRAGERNSELGGGKNTMAGWDYEAGKARAGATMQSDGVWVMPGQGGGGGGGGTGIPGGALIAQAQLAAKQRYQQRLAGMNKQRQGVARTGGYKMDVSEDGLVKNWRVDPYNQYGTFQLLNRQQANQGYAVQGQNIDRGLGTRGGLAAQNLNDARFEWGQQDAALGQSLVDQLGRIDEDQQGAKYEMDQSLWQLQLQALQMAAQQGDYGYGGGGGWDDDVSDDGGLFTAPIGTDFSAVNRLLNSKAKAPKPKASNPYATGQNNKPKLLPKPKASNPYATGQNKKPAKKKGGKK